jgi:hypothetical protein
MIEDASIKAETHFENPFGTAEGQNIVSISETFWHRMAREGHWVTNMVEARAVTNAGGYNWGGGHYPAIGKVLYPKTIISSCDVAAIHYFRVTVGNEGGLSSGVAVPTNGILYFCALSAAGIPVTFDFDGEVYCKGAGLIEFGCKPLTGSGVQYVSFHCLEVSENV